MVSGGPVNARPIPFFVRDSVQVVCPRLGDIVFVSAMALSLFDRAQLRTRFHAEDHIIAVLKGATRRS